MAKSRPPKDKPWYHVLVDGQSMQTYVAERNLEADEMEKPVDNPLVEEVFEQFVNGVYVRKRSTN